MIMRRLFLILSLLGVFLVSYAQVDSLSGPVSRLDSAVIVSESAKQRLLQTQLGLDAIDEGIVRKVPAFPCGAG